MKIYGNYYYKSFPIVIMGIFLIIINSCEINELEKFSLTPNEKALILYNESDTIVFRNRSNEQHFFYVNKKNNFYYDTIDFLGVPKYKSETGSIYFKRIAEEDYSGGVFMNKDNENRFNYVINLDFPNVYFEISYTDDSSFKHRLQKTEQIEINGLKYNDVYIFNNATSETAEPTQKIYLNTEYGFLKLEDLEKDVVYTIVRD